MTRCTLPVVLGELFHALVAGLLAMQLFTLGAAGVAVGVPAEVFVGTCWLARVSRHARCRPKGLLVQGALTRRTVPYEQVFAVTWTAAVPGRNRTWAKAHVIWSDESGTFRRAAVACTWGDPAAMQAAGRLWSQLPPPVHLCQETGDNQFAGGTRATTITTRMRRLNEEHLVPSERFSEQWGWVEGEAELSRGRVVHHLIGARLDRAWTFTRATCSYLPSVDEEEQVEIRLEGSTGRLRVSRFYADEAVRQLS